MESRHEASVVLASFRYQLLQSLSAWLGLQPGEVLWLEVSEDFSIAAHDRGTDVQVKASPKRLSLRSSDVKDVLTRFWGRIAKTENPRSLLVFISRGQAAKEQGIPFPGNQCGLLYWKSAAGDADTGPLRSALSIIFAGLPLAEWLATHPIDEELRSRLLRRVQWTLGASDSRSLEEEVQEGVRHYFDREGFPAGSADVGTKVLLQHVFETASNADPARRRLRREDLSDVSGRLFRPVVLAAIRRTAIAGWAPSQSILVRVIAPPGSLTIQRDAAIAKIIERVAGEPVLWLMGPNGVGKSTLANLIAWRSGGEWLCLDLRPVQDDQRAVLAAWQDLRWMLDERPPVAGVVVNDCDNQAFEALRSRLPSLIESLSVRGARVIVTSSNEPSAARLAEMGASQKAIVVAPYFTIDELRALIALPGGPDATMLEPWANLVSLTTSGGHPVLAAAKISNLRSREWPPEALTEDLLGVPGEAVRATREESRRRLLAELPSDSARELLRRLASIYDSADDQLLRVLGRSDPPLAGVGDAIAVLRGSWIEVMPGGYLRISPLIADLAQDVGRTEGQNWRRIAARHWIAEPLDNRTLTLCFWNAFLGEEVLVLANVAEGIQTLPQERIRGAAALLAPLVVFRTDRSMLPGHPAIAPLLRLLQFTVADAIEDHAVARAAAERLLVEIDENPIEELRALNTSIAAFKVVTAESTEIPTAVIIDYVLRARGVATRVEALGIPPLNEIPRSVGMAGFIFASFGARLRSSKRLAELIVAMDAVNEEDRRWLLDAVSATLDGLAVLFQGPWANEQLAGDDAHKTLIHYERIAEVTTGWRRADITTEIACARSVILDEMIGDTPGAIATVDEAIKIVGPNWRLIQQKAKVLAHEERHEVALSLYMSIEGEMTGKGFDGAMALRGAALSAASLGDLPEAARLINKARSCFEGNPFFKALSAGFSLDEAFAQWRSGDRQTALLTMADALDAMEGIDPKTSRQNERTYQLAKYVVGLFREEAKPFSQSAPQQLTFGQASALAGDGSLTNVDLSPLADLWRLLEVVEIMTGINVGIDRRSQTKQTGPATFAVGVAIAEARFSRALASDADLSTIIGLGLAAVSTAAAAIELRQSGVQRVEPQSTVDRERMNELLSGRWRERILSVPLDTIVWHGLKGTLEGRFIDGLGRACRANGIGDEIIDPLLKAASGLYPISADASYEIALPYLLSERFDPSESLRARFRRDLLLLSQAVMSAARLALERPVVAAVTSGWRFVLKKQAFLLRNPRDHSEIKAAILVAETKGLGGIAQLLLASAPVVGVELTSSWEELLAAVREMP